MTPKKTAYPSFNVSICWISWPSVNVNGISFGLLVRQKQVICICHLGLGEVVMGIFLLFSFNGRLIEKMINTWLDNKNNYYLQPYFRRIMFDLKYKEHKHKTKATPLQR